MDKDGGMENFSVEDFGLDGVGAFGGDTPAPSTTSVTSTLADVASMADDKAFDLVMGALEKLSVKPEYKSLVTRTSTVLREVHSSEQFKAQRKHFIEMAANAAQQIAKGAGDAAVAAIEAELAKLTATQTKPMTGGAYKAIAEHYYGGALPSSPMTAAIAAAYVPNAVNTGYVGPGSGLGSIPAFTGGDDDDDFAGGDVITATYTSGRCGVCPFGPLGGDCSGGAVSVGELAKYTASINSETKNRLIDDLVDIARELGVKVASADERDKKVENLLRALPDPKKKSFKKDAEFQSKVCKKMADELNKKFGKVIETKQSSAAVCQQIHELIYSLKHGMHAEFLGVMNGIKQALRNLLLLKSAQDQKIEEYNKLVENTEDHALSAKVAKTQDAYKMLREEISRQIDILTNMLNVTLSKTDQDVMELLKSSEDVPGMISKLKGEPGSNEFGETLMKVLSETGTSSHLAALIERALRTVGMSVADYREDIKRNEFEKKLDDKLMSAKLDKEELHEFLKAKELLLKNFSLRADISKDLKTMSGGVSDKVPVFQSSIDREIDNKRKLRDVILKSFSTTLNRQFVEILRALDALSDKVGVVLPVTDALDHLRVSLSRLRPYLTKKNMHIALSGYYKDALSRERREQFISELRLIKGSLEACMETSAYQAHRGLFKDAHTALGSMIETIDRFSDAVTAKIGNGEIEQDEGGAPLKGGDDDDDEIDGGSDLPAVGSIAAAFKGGYADLGLGATEQNVMGGYADLGLGATEQNVMGGADDKLPDVSGYLRSAILLSDITRKFDYYFRAAQVRDNFKLASKDIDSFAENYSDIRGEAVAAEIDKLKKEMNEKLKLLVGKSENTALQIAITKAIDALGVAPLGTPADKAEFMKKTKEFVEGYYGSRINFWRTCEAIDEYMRVFVNMVVKNPNDLKDIKSMLDDTEVFAKWYRDSHGRALHELFDSFPNAANAYPSAEYFNGSDGKHYYENVSKAVAAGSAPGDHMNSRLVYVPGQKNANDFLKKSSVATCDMLALKNLLSIFVYIGSKFGSKELFKNNFMSPTQIYRNLCDYLKYGAFSLGNAIGTNPLSVQFSIRLRSSSVHTSEDKFFTYCIKSLCAKVLTVVGLYDVMQRPHEPMYMSPVRTILGAGPEIPRVEEGATELYMRLPLLAEFYRDLFGFYNLDEADKNKQYAFVKNETYTQERLERFSMMPEVEGTFTDLVRFVFKRNHYLSLRDYSNDELAELIAIVNNIYQKYGRRDTLVRDVVKDFVSEMNRRYGLVSKDDRDKYQKMFTRRYDYADTTVSEEDIERHLPILPDESADWANREVNAPSRKYETAPALGSDDSMSSIKHHRISDEHYRLMYRFRCMLDNYFRKKTAATCSSTAGEIGDRDKKFLTAGCTGIDAYSFKPVIKAARLQLKQEKDNQAQFKIVSNMIRGSDVFGKADEIKYIMFHETVVAGLNVLSAIHTLLGNFQRRVLEIDLVDVIKECKTPLTLTGIVPIMRTKYFKPRPGDLASAAGTNFWDITSAESVRDLYTLGAAGNIGQLITPGNAEHIFHRIFELASGLANDSCGLVEIKIDDRIHLNFSGLRREVESLFECVRGYLDVFRPLINKDMFNRYVDKRVAGSYYWLQEQLMEKIFIGREASETQGFSPYVNLGRLNAILNDSLEILMGCNNAWKKAGETPIKTWKYDNVVWSLLLDGFGPGRPYTLQNVDIYGTKHPLEKLLLVNKGNVITVDPNFGARISVYSRGTSYVDTQLGLTYQFNQLLAKYLESAFDSINNKMYIGAIDAIANGPLNTIVVDWTKGLRDVVNVNNVRDKGGVILTQNKDMKIEDLTIRPHNTMSAIAIGFDESVLLSSLSQVLKVVTTSRNATSQAPIYMLENIADVTSIMKEKYRVNMPAFYNLFKKLIDRCELVKKLTNLKELEVAQKSKTTSFIDKLIAGCSSVLSSIERVMRELGDEPKYFELKQNFIQEYRMLNKTDPLMPLSSAFYVLRPEDAGAPVKIADNSFMPVWDFGSEEFKFLYGTRELLNRPAHKILPERVPGHQALVDLYNVSVGEREQLKRGNVDKCLVTMVTLLRYLHETKNVKRKVSLGSSHEIIRQVLVNGNTAKTNDNRLLKTIFVDAAFNNNKPVYSMIQTLGEILRMTESTLKRDKMSELAKYIGGSITVNNDLTILNLLDLNVVPINVNAMMRDIPMANLYNFAYTYDRMIVDMLYGLNDEFSNMLIDTLCGEAYTGSRNLPNVLTHGSNIYYNLTDTPPTPAIDSALYTFVSSWMSDSGIDKYSADQVIGSDAAGNIIASPKSTLPQFSTFGFPFGIAPVNNPTPGSAKLLLNPILNRLLRNMSTNKVVKSSKELFTSLLINPYKSILPDSETNWFNNIMRGDSNVPLGRPKYLSDQVFNKVLFGELYVTDYEESGPRSKARPTTNLTYIKTDRPDNADDDEFDLREDFKGQLLISNRGKLRKQTVNVSAADKNNLVLLGQSRLNTILIRNLMFIVNSFRVLRLKLRRDLMYNKSITLRSHAVTRDDVTEFTGNQTQRDKNWSEEF